MQLLNVLHFCEPWTDLQANAPPLIYAFSPGFSPAQIFRIWLQCVRLKI